MKHDLVVVGASLGGLQTIEKIFFTIPEDFLAPILIVNHFTERFDPKWVENANKRSQMDIQWAQNGAIKRGIIYIAPPDKHLTVVNRREIALSNSPPIFSCRPAIDPLFISAANALKSGVIAVLLTGLNQDGSQGLQEVKSKGGIVIVQDPKTAFSPQMPAIALEKVKADYIESPEEIKKTLLKLNTL